MFYNMVVVGSCECGHHHHFDMRDTSSASDNQYSEISEAVR